MNETNYISFVRNTQARELLLKWWKGLDENRGDRAAIRRCHTAFDVALTPAFIRLRSALKEIFPVNDESLSVVVGLAAHVRAIDGSCDFPAQMARPVSPGGNARVSGLRFRRLLKVKNSDELFPAFIRIVRLLGGNVNLVSLAEDAYWWNERTRKRWAAAYYESAPMEA